MKIKIIATMGPASFPKEVLTKMIRNGVSIIRFNFSHCKYEEFAALVPMIRAIAKKEKKDVKILQDLQGPRIRVGMIAGDKMPIEADKIYHFSHKKSNGYHDDCIEIDDAYLHMAVKKGEPFYLLNGAIQMEVVEVKNGIISAIALNNGILSSRKGINVPRTSLTRGVVTPKDIKDAKFGAEIGVDYVALSFVQSGADVLKLRKVLGKDSKTQIISKIERDIALDNIDEIIQLSDGIMIARGDLGIEVPMEDLPILQKDLIRHSHWHGKPAIVATQMMMSMITENSPTRAEVSDIANAVLDKADAIMLSEETAVGVDPAHVITTMKKIAMRTEKYMNKLNLFDVMNENLKK